MPMPYHLSKGPWISILEDAANDAARRPGLLEDLRDPSRDLVTIAVTDQQNAASFDPHGPLADRLKRNWFGYDATGAPQAPFDPLAPRRTGYWVDYHGDTETIVRTALLRSLEVAMGLEHDDPASRSSREWPIEVFWTCPRGWFECWVTWREQDATRADGGQVTLIICTPADPVNMVRPAFGQPLHPEPGVRHVGPTDSSAAQGMWLVAHEDHRTHWVEWIDPTAPVLSQVTEALVVAALDKKYGADVLIGFDDFQGSTPWPVPYPSAMWEGVGDVVVVSPPEVDGGVSPTGRRYQP
jgi:hypothetical protein